MEHTVAPPEVDQNTGPVQEAVAGLSTSVALILVILRFYVRARMVKPLWWDDFFLLLGMVRIKKLPTQLRRSVLIAPSHSPLPDSA